MSTGHAVSRHLSWTAYALMFAQGFTGYTVSYFTPYMETELHTPTWASSTPNVAIAVGYLTGAVMVPMAVRRLGPAGAIRLWAAGMALASLLMGLGGSVWAVAVGAYLVGLAGAGVVVHTVSSLGSQANGLYMVRSTVWSMFGALLAPLVLWAATQTTGWSTGMLLMVPITLLMVPLTPPAPTRHGEAEPVEPVEPVLADAPRAERPTGLRPLGRSYWTAWSYLVLVIGAEFTFVAWGPQLIVSRTGIALVDATALASVFVAGELAGRILWGLGIGARVDRVRSLRVMTVVAALGSAVLWAAPIPAVAAGGLLLGGLGIALAFPVTSSLAMAYAPHAPVRAGAQLNLSWGLSILTAPLVLGIAAGAAGVGVGWALSVGLLVAAWLVILRLPRPGDALPARGAIATPRAVDAIAS